jgi:hypothetical protein
MTTPIAVCETAEFISDMRKLMSDEERHTLIDHVAYNPTAGDLVPGGGGIRKLRWRLTGRGKRGGARVIYYYHNVDFPIFMLTGYAKNVREDLTARERNEFRQLTKALIESYRETGR